MRRGLLVALTVGFIAVGGTTMALAKDGGRSDRSTALTVDGQPFELRIDPRLDAQFGKRTVGGVKAADIVTRALGGGRVTRVELAALNGRPIWEVKVSLNGGERELNVDATSGRILGR